MSYLEDKMSDLLAEASVIAEASAAGLSEKTSSGKAGSRAPTTSGSSTYDQIKARFDSCKTDRQRQDAILWAKARIKSIKRRESKPMTPKEYRFWLVEEHEGAHYADVAKAEGISPSYVRKIREEHERDALRGKPVRKAA